VGMRYRTRSAGLANEFDLAAKPLSTAERLTAAPAISELCSQRRAISAPEWEIESVAWLEF